MAFLLSLIAGNSYTHIFSCLSCEYKDWIKASKERKWVVSFPNFSGTQQYHRFLFLSHFYFVLRLCILEYCEAAVWFLSPWLKCYTLLSSLHQHQNLQCRILHNTSFSPRTITVINLVAINRKYSSAHDVLLSFFVCVHNSKGKRRKRMEMKEPSPCERLGMAA